MRLALSVAVAALVIAAPAYAQSELENGFDGALRGCEEWVLNPASWAKGVAPFVATVGLGPRMGLVAHVDEAVLPPPALRAGNHYWRINATDKAGYFLIVSDRQPMCHITGGGDADLQTVVASVLGTPGFAGRWELIKESSQGDMVSSEFRNRVEPAFSIVISRANKPGLRRDRVQVMATAVYRVVK